MKKNILFIAAFLSFGLLFLGVYDMTTQTTPPWRKRKKISQDSSQVVLPKIIYFTDSQIVSLKKNDTLSVQSLADFAGMSVPQIQKLNPLFKDSVRVFVRAIHTVQKDENLEKIAQKYQVNQDRLKNLEGKKIEKISENQKILVLIPKN